MVLKYLVLIQKTQEASNKFKPNVFFLMDCVKRNVKTTQVSHNHTSGKPLPHHEDIVNLLGLK